MAFNTQVVHLGKENTITAAEVTLKGDKGAGYDAIRPEMPKALNRQRVLWLICVCQVAWCSGKWSNNWEFGVIIPIHMKGHVSLQFAWKSVSQTPWKTILRDNWTKTGWYPERFSPRPYHYRPNFHSPTKFSQNFGVCHRRLHMFCQSQERPGSSWKILRSAAEVWCWRLPVTGRDIIKLLSVSVWANFNSQPFTVSVGWRPGLVLARMSQVWSSRQILLVLPTHSHFLKNQSFKYLNWRNF